MENSRPPLIRTRPEHALNHGDTHMAWRRMLKLETAFLLLLFLLMIVVLVLGAFFHVRPWHDPAYILFFGMTGAGIVHRLRHLKGGNP